GQHDRRRIRAYHRRGNAPARTGFGGHHSIERPPLRSSHHRLPDHRRLLSDSGGLSVGNGELYSRAEISRHPAANLTLKRAKARAPERGIYAASTVVVWVECRKFYAQRYTTPFFARIGTMNGETTRPPSGGDAVDPSSDAVWLTTGTATLLE